MPIISPPNLAKHEGRTWLDPDQIEWETIGPGASDTEPADEQSRLLAILQIGTCFMHLEAIETEAGSYGTGAIDPDMQNSLDQIMVTADGDGDFSTMVYRGREYVVWAVPHSA